MIRQESKKQMKRRTTDAMGRVRKIHFVGIGGSGMGGIAEVVLNLGYQVSGSDLKENSVTRRLADHGATISIGHRADSVSGAEVLVVSSAVDESNVEVQAARMQRIPVIPRALMLAELMRFRFGIAVAGTHGKTTTTSLIASILHEGGVDPTYVIGGRLNSTASHAGLGAGQYLVAEADESDASFLVLQPIMAVVTNIDADHLSTYQGDFSILKNTFVEFLKRLPFYGLAVVCLDDPTIREMLVEIASPVLTYGLDSDADLRATDIHQQGRTTHFTLVERGGRSCPVTVNMPGIHNVLNALATIAIAREVGVEDESIFKGLASFSGVGRRFECYENVKLGATSVTWVDDYGHHPREIEATLQAAKASWPDRRIILVFQPHRYSRTRDLLDDFAMILSRADKLVLTEVYAAGEDPIAGADGRALARAVRGHGAVEPVFVPEITRVLNTLENIVNEGDIVLAMGAGSIGSLSKGWQPEPRGAE